jgi:DNA polymerase-3 subunit beta
MKFKISQDVFSKNLLEVGRVISSRTALPILAGIKITAEIDRIILTGSNSDIIIQKTIPLEEIQETGSVVVSAKYFSELIKRLSGTVMVESCSKHITVHSEEIMTHFNCFNADEYPDVPIFNSENHTYINGKELIEVLKRTSFAVSKNETRPVLTGVQLTFSMNKLTAVATDSVRLALLETVIDSSFVGSFILPSGSVNELLKLVQQNSEKVEIQLTENFIHFKNNDTSFYSRLIAGNYPNTSSLIPNDNKTVLSMSRESLVKGIDRAILFAGEWKNNNVKLSLTDNNKLSITSSSSEIGTIEEYQNINHLEGDSDVSISIDGNFMLDALKVIREPEIKIRFNGKMKPIVIESTEKETACFHLISPVRS